MYAYTLGISDEASIYDVGIYNTFTRVQLAQMLSVFATDVLGRTHTSQASCLFSDTDDQSLIQQQAITQVCQL